MKPVLPKLQEFGEDGDEQADRGNTVSSQRTKRGRVKKTVVATEIEFLFMISLDLALYAD